MWFAVSHTTCWCHDIFAWSRRAQLVGFVCGFFCFKDYLFLNREIIRENDLILLFLKSKIILGKDQTVLLSWLPPSWHHVVFKWNIWHIFQLGCYFVLLDKAIQNSLKNKLNGRGISFIFFFFHRHLWLSFKGDVIFHLDKKGFDPNSKIPIFPS